jgi:hypothetical protein
MNAPVKKSPPATTLAEFDRRTNFVWSVPRTTDQEFDAERLLSDMERVIREANGVRLYALLRVLFTQMESGLVLPQEVAAAIAAEAKLLETGGLKTGDLDHITGLRIK